MATPGKPIDGQHVSAEILIDGKPVAALDQITKISEKSRYNTITSQIIGQPGEMISKDHLGWEGTIEIAVRSKALDQFIDTWNQGLRNLLPQTLTFTVANKYRDGTTTRYLYTDVQVEFDRMAERGQAVKITVPWTTGADRVPF